MRSRWPRGVALALFGALWAVPATAQVLGGPPSAPFPWGRWAAALTLCLLLAVGGALALRLRLSGRPAPAWPRSLGGWLRPGAEPGRRLVLVELVPVNATLQVCLLRCDDVDYLLAATPTGVTQLAPRPRDAAPEAAQ